MVWNAAERIRINKQTNKQKKQPEMDLCVCFSCTMRCWRSRWPSCKQRCQNCRASSLRNQMTSKSRIRRLVLFFAALRSMDLYHCVSSSSRPACLQQMSSMWIVCTDVSFTGRLTFDACKQCMDPCFLPFSLWCSKAFLFKLLDSYWTLNWAPSHFISQEMYCS